MTNPTAQETPKSADDAGLRVMRPKSGFTALGMAVSFLMADPAFQRLRFGHWARVLAGQIQRGHFVFVTDQDKVVGFAGWALTNRDSAEQWLAGRGELSFQDCQAGDFVVINVWKASTPAANQSLVEAFRRMFAAKQALYFKRFYPDGRMRPSRLKVNAFVNRHLAAARAKTGAAAAETSGPDPSTPD